MTQALPTPYGPLTSVVRTTVGAMDTTPNITAITLGVRDVERVAHSRPDQHYIAGYGDASRQYE